MRAKVAYNERKHFVLQKVTLYVVKGYPLHGQVLPFISCPKTWIRKIPYLFVKQQYKQRPL